MLPPGATTLAIEIHWASCRIMHGGARQCGLSHWSTREAIGALLDPPRHGLGLAATLVLRHAATQNPHS